MHKLTLFSSSKFSQWLAEYTAKEKWVGGFTDAAGRPVFSEERLKSILSEGFVLESTKQMPFLIREHQRKNQVSSVCMYACE
jgi:hypothetical protein